MQFKGFSKTKIVGFLLILTACGPYPDDYFTTRTVGNGSDTPRGVAVIASNQANFSGSWLSDCYANASIPGARFRETIIAGTSTTRRVTAYIDANCASEIYQLTFSASHFFDSSAHLTENFSQLSVIPTQAAGTQLLNSSGFCSRSNWAMNTTQVVSEIAYCGMARSRVSTIQIFENGDLYEMRGGLRIHYHRQN